MKYLLLLTLCLTGFRSITQNLQLVYDLRHTTDPKNNAKNYPTLYFEYFKSPDSGRAFIKPGSFLFKMQADATGQGNNAGKMYFQVAQTLRFWEPKVFLHLSISGGLGVTEPKQYTAMVPVRRGIFSRVENEYLLSRKYIGQSMGSLSCNGYSLETINC